MPFLWHTLYRVYIEAKSLHTERGSRFFAQIMINIKKGPNLKIIPLSITVLFLFTGIGYPSSISKNSLRVPLKNDYSQMEEIMQDGKSQASANPLMGPFRIPGTNTLFNIHEITDHKEMRGYVDEWFRSKIKRYFEKSVWEKDIEKLKNYPRGSMIMLQSETGEILGISFHHKETNFMLFQDKDARSEHIGDFYFTDHMEISGPLRKKGLGSIIMAKRAEKVLNDPNMNNEDRMLVTRPATEESDNYLDNIGGEKYIRPYEKVLEKTEERFSYSKEEEITWTWRIFRKNALDRLIENAKKRLIPQQLSLFEQINDEDNNSLTIERISPDQYDEYAEILSAIFDEEKFDVPINMRRDFGIVEDKENPGIRIFGYMSSILKQDKKTRSETIEALFIIKDKDGKILGARLLYKPGEIKILKLKALLGMDAIRQLYQYKYRDYLNEGEKPRPKNIGTLLRIKAFEWMIKNAHKKGGYEKYAAFIADDNKEGNLKSLKNILNLFGLKIESTKHDSFYGESGAWYLINLKADLPTVDAIDKKGITTLKENL